MADCFREVFTIRNSVLLIRIAAHHTLLERCACAPQQGANMDLSFPGGIQIAGCITPEYSGILSPEALIFVAALHRQFDARRRALLAQRSKRQQAFDEGAMPQFLPETEHIRSADWCVAE